MIKLDRPAPGIGPTNPGQSQSTTPTPQAKVNREAIQKPAGYEVGGGSKAMPNLGHPSGPSSVQQAAATLLAALANPKGESLSAAQAALVAAASYGFRRSRGARRKGTEMLDAVDALEDPQLSHTGALREVLEAEGLLHLNTEEGTVEAVARLIVLLQQFEDGP